MAQNDTSRSGNGGNLGFEAELFKTADKLRGNMEPSDYKHIDDIRKHGHVLTPGRYVGAADVEDGELRVRDAERFVERTAS